jgi:glycosyltransferase involved in cell wall biosynthesis
VTVVDVAGGHTGGAARWRGEIVGWAGRNSSRSVQLIGEHERVEPRWLFRREAVGWKSHRIATNNVSFVGGTGPRIVLLRNALHFLWPSELGQIPGLPTGLARQIPIVRATARRADVIVVPCATMGDRVAHALPGLRRRIVVRHHPLSAAELTRPASHDPGIVLYPVRVSAYKDVVGALDRLTDVLRVIDPAARIVVTADADELGAAGAVPSVRAVGSKSLAEMQLLWATAAAVYMPFSVESFSYPVAEGRSLGVPVIALDTDQNREIGAGALFGYHDGDPESLAQAAAAALAAKISPEPEAFDPDQYFAWLMSLG